MKPGSSDRCKSKHGKLRCHRRHEHKGPHSAPTGNKTTQWLDPEPETAR